MVDLREDVYFFAPERAEIGSRVSIHPLSYIDATGGLKIGSDTSIAHGVTIMTTSHQLEDPKVPIRDQGLSNRPVVIGDGTWIGAGAKILGGVTVGRGAVIAAGAVANRDVPPNAVVVGVPARVVRIRGE
ncbi:acyltransferase [Nocardioides sp. AE5]|uniref:acyltransferase n=1 Tax=Nocardioides sp. AE5 TaxID=2962573 RepID=UPI002881416B|nr:acyltransferase [Nocardioides sp. AE5]MDT0202632.1 acyltransferase [Nocardioides sp. AE5]